MIYKRFRISIFIRVTIIVVLALLLAFITAQQQMLFVPLAIVIALIAAIMSLILYIEKSNKDLTHFLLSIRQGSFTESYTSGNRGKQYKELSDALNEVVREFARLNEEKELQYQYLQALNENISVAIISFDADGNLLSINPAARQLLNFPGLAKIEQLKEIDARLHETIMHILSGERAVIRIFLEEEQIQLSVQSKEILLQNKLVRIVLLQNLNNELEEKEIEAWHQLMSVLTHEIMNSVTPIVSLTTAIQHILIRSDGTPKDLGKLSDENIEDVFSSLSTITSRSHGLLKFVNAYKAYSKTIEFHPETTDVAALVTRITGLLAPDLQKFNVKLEINQHRKPVKAKADVVLMEQVVINLIKNAIEAVAHDGSGVITIDISSANNGARIAIADNGAGMDAETMVRIFIPFFTTKPSGSGIGLSLSRQIMKIHNGSIKVHSNTGNGSVFTIEWN
jgi:nitrogen fixation/metabolism regulation signal transduction histidine kinase